MEIVEQICMNMISSPVRDDVESPRAPGSILLLADDLTGACDAAAAFLASGHDARIWLGAEALSTAGETVQTFNTESRALSSEEAAAAVARAAAAWGSTQRRLVFKKVDSAGRGPIAAEVLALEHILKPSFVVLAPAFPAAGRTVKGGVLATSDAAGTSELLPLAELFPADARGRIGVIGHPKEMEAALRAGRSILLCDAVTQDDLTKLVVATQELAVGETNCLYAGSAGLARALAETSGIARPQPPYPHAERLMVVVGTEHRLTQLQLAYLHPVSATVHVERLLWSGKERERIFAAFASFAPDALLLTGGDTALIALRALAAESILLGGECAPGIPWGRVQGGAADGLIVITKSGGFGTPRTLQEIVERLRKGAR